MDEFQDCGICQEPTTCAVKSSYVTLNSDANARVTQMNIFVKEARERGLFDNVKSESMKPGITIELPCGHCFHTKCQKSWMEKSEKNWRATGETSNIHKCSFCLYPLPALPKTAESMMAYLWRICTTKDGELNFRDSIAQSTVSFVLTSTLAFLLQYYLRSSLSAYLEQAQTQMGRLGGGSRTSKAGRTNNVHSKSKSNSKSPSRLNRVGKRKSKSNSTSKSKNNKSKSPQRKRAR